MTSSVSLSPAVTVHGLAQAEAALRAAGPAGVMLLSAPGAGGFAGAAWFLALAAAATARQHAATAIAALDCADRPGTALAALREGARLLVLDADCPAFAAVAGAAACHGARLLGQRPESLDMAWLDLRRRDDLARLRAWLAIGMPQKAGIIPTM